MLSQLKKPIAYLKGVGPKRAEKYEKLGIRTVYDLLCFFPRDYLDLSSPVEISAAMPNEQALIKAKVFKKLPPARIKKGLTIFKAAVTDGSDDMTVTIYNSEYAFNGLAVGGEYLFLGKVTGSVIRKEMGSPLIFNAASDEKIQPVYHLTEGLTQQALRSHVRQALGYLDSIIYEPLPEEIRKREGLCSLVYAFENIHYPKDVYSMQQAKKRLVFDELLTLMLSMLMLKSRSREVGGYQLTDTDAEPFFEALPFEPTACQRRAVGECLADMQRKTPMNRLLQGDVGSGKTAVAAALAYAAAKNGFQTALMAPTEILSVQHYETMRRFLEPLGVKVSLLTGSMTPKQKEDIKKELAEGLCSVAVGTHALVQKTTQFKDLALVITDEQHRFGVEQRAALAQKGKNPHKLVMSATPIPRTLALMIYGDLDISVLDELPKGRQPVETYAVTGKLRPRVYNYIRQHLDEGRQGYIVCAMIEEGENELQSAKAYAETLSKGEFKNYRVGLLHGKLPAAQKEAVMADFCAHKLDLLVSTTVIEVGVDVPNAAIMVIENADRFGLSQLHQLRGRVGRGEFKSSCVLITDNVKEDTVRRLKILSKTNDGFKISEEDLKLRGPGDFFGSRQHGLPELKIASMSEDMAVMQRAGAAARAILERDPGLEEPAHRHLRDLAHDMIHSIED
ncbi:MAG: ATP-dependent DNA helicase RecG [Ruminococcus sp.]|nr:ATP-dependent DNA helicase RecG [Ruminococcus sp.]